MSSSTASTATGSQSLQTIAVLSLSGTTVTATVPPNTSGVAVVDGTTLSFRQQGITLSDGEVFSLGFDGLVASTTTAVYTEVSIPAGVDSTRKPSGTSIIVTDSSTSLPPDTPLTSTSGSAPSNVIPGVLCTETANPASCSAASAAAASSSTTSSGMTTSQSTPLTSSGSQVSSLTTASSTASAASSSSSSASGTVSTTTDSQSSTSAAAASTTSGASGASEQAQNVGFGGMFVAVLGLLVTFGAMAGM